MTDIERLSLPRKEADSEFSQVELPMKIATIGLSLSLKIFDEWMLTLVTKHVNKKTFY